MSKKTSTTSRTANRRAARARRKARKNSAAARAQQAGVPKRNPRILRLSGMRALKRPSTIIAAIEATPALDKAMRALDREIDTLHDVSATKAGHRRRKAGRHTYAYLDFVMSKYVDIEAWYDEKATDADFARWDYAERPSRRTMARRFKDLEENAQHVRQKILNLVIRAVADFDPEIVQAVHVDGTEQPTAATLYHDCRPGECPLGKEGQPLGKFARAPRVHKASAKEQAAHRQAIVDGEIDPDDVRESTGTQEALKVVTGGVQQAHFTEEGWLRFKTGGDSKTKGHWYCIRDGGAGVRAYDRDGNVFKAWAGRTNIKASSHKYDAPVVIMDGTASKSEVSYLLEIFDQIEEATGLTPEYLVTDAGPVSRKTALELARRGCQQVAPMPTGTSKSSAHSDRCDCTGVARCPHCGGTATRVGPAQDSLSFYYECDLKPTAKCKRFRIAVSEDPIRLGLVQACDPIYQYLQDFHSNQEHHQRHIRERYQVAEKDYSHIPKRLGDYVQRLRAYVGMLVDWVRISLRLGLIELPEVAIKRHTGRAAVYAPALKRCIEKFQAVRRKLALDLPYGAKAVEMGTGPERPPNPERDRPRP